MAFDHLVKIRSVFSKQKGSIVAKSDGKKQRLQDPSSKDRLRLGHWEEEASRGRRIFVGPNVWVPPPTKEPRMAPHEKLAVSAARKAKPWQLRNESESRELSIRPAQMAQPTLAYWEGRGGNAFRLEVAMQREKLLLASTYLAVLCPSPELLICTFLS